jgi:predicted dehydrogenase
MNPLLSRRSFLSQTAALSAVGALAEGSQPTNPGSAPSSTASTPVVDASAANPGAVPLAPPDRQPPDLKLPVIPPRRIGWAIVGLGKLALEEIMPAFAGCEYSRPVALVSGHPEKAATVAKAYGIKESAIYSYENFDRLADNPEVEAVYIVLPNSMHAEYTMRALRAGKHVLCEKPMAVTSDEGRSMIAAAKEASRKLMLAYRLHFEPLNRKVMDLCAKKAFGKIKIFESSNCQNVEAPNIRLSGPLGGGPLGDVGVYSINAARYVLGEEPVEATAMQHQPKDDPRFREVPESVVYTLRYPSGAVAHCGCSFGTAESRRYRVHCENGLVEMDPAFSYRGLRLFVTSGDPTKGTGEKAELQVPQVNHFTKEMDAFSTCILKDQEPATPGVMGLQDLLIMEAIMAAAKSGRTVKIG